jgi:hypothetical protein
LKLKSSLLAFPSLFSPFGFSYAYNFSVILYLKYFQIERTVDCISAFLLAVGFSPGSSIVAGARSLSHDEHSRTQMNSVDSGLVLRSELQLFGVFSSLI